MNLSIENWIHVRESIDRHLKTLDESHPVNGSPAKELKEKKSASLTECRRLVNEEINDLQFEADRNPTSHLHETSRD